MSIVHLFHYFFYNMTFNVAVSQLRCIGCCILFKFEWVPLSSLWWSCWAQGECWKMVWKYQEVEPTEGCLVHWRYAFRRACDTLSLPAFLLSDVICSSHLYSQGYYLPQHITAEWASHQSLHHAFWTFSFQNCELIIPFFVIQLLCLWFFVITMKIA